MPFDPLNPSVLVDIDVDFLLNECATNVKEKLLDAGFSSRDISTCGMRRPRGRYARYVQEKHQLLFDDKYKFDVALLQHVENLKIWVVDDDSARDWIGQGYGLARMLFYIYGPDRFTATISADASKRSGGKSKIKNPKMEQVIRYFRSEHADASVRDITRFGNFVGSETQFDELGIEVLKSKNEANRITYIFRKIGDDENYEYVTRDSINRLMKVQIDSGLVKFL